jgi:hypothetical protein
MVDRVDQAMPDFGERHDDVRLTEKPGHRDDSLRSTAARNELRAAASGSVEPALMRRATAIPTAATQPAVMASIHADQVSVPVPNPWTTAIGQAA